MKKKLFSMLLVVAMLCSLLVPSVFAASVNGTVASSDFTKSKVTVSDKAGGGLTVTVTQSGTADTSVNYDFGFFKVDDELADNYPTISEFIAADGAESLSDVVNNTSATNLAGEYVQISFSGGAFSKDIDLKAHGAGTYYVVAWLNGLNTGATGVDISVDDNGKLKTDYAGTVSVGNFPSGLTYGDSKSREVTITVTSTGIKDLTNAVVTSTDTTNFTITGGTLGTVTGTNTTAKLKLTATAPGTYKTTVKLAADNGVTAEVDVSVTIGKADQAAPTLSKTDMDADGNGGQITITNFAAGKTYQIKGPGDADYKDATLTDTNKIAVTTAGKYSVRVKGDTNYKESPAAEVTIAQAGAAVADLSDKTVTYNGSAQSVPVKVTQDGADKTSEYTVYYTGKDGTTYPKSNTAPTNAGTYTVTVEKTVGGTALPQTATLVIEKAPVTVEFSETDKTLADVKTKLSGVVAADEADVTLNLTWTDDAATTIAAGQEYTWTGSLTGAKAANYELKIEPLKINASGGIVISGGTQSYTVTYIAGAHGNFSSDAATTEKVEKNASPKNVPVVHPHDNYRFMGWTMDGKTIVDPSTQKITRNVTFTALYEECDHMAYMVGRSDTQFAPNGNLTRAEAATILARLTEGFSENGTYPAAPYSDLNTSAWYVKYINFAASKGIVNGRPDGTFDPDASITRAEFATMIANFAGIAPVNAASASTDVDGHWAAGYITALEQASIVTGYEDGTFRPNRTITRAEAATMVNGAIDRTPDTNLDLAENSYTNPFTDVNAGQWFFAQVMEATVNHVTAHFHTGK